MMRVTKLWKRHTIVSSVHAFEKTHGYFVSERKMQTEIAAEKQQRMMEHLNSVHLS